MTIQLLNDVLALEAQASQAWANLSQAKQKLIDSVQSGASPEVSRYVSVGSRKAYSDSEAVTLLKQQIAELEQNIVCNNAVAIHAAELDLQLAEEALYAALTTDELSLLRNKLLQMQLAEPQVEVKSRYLILKRKRLNAIAGDQLEQDTDPIRSSLADA